MSDKQPLIDEAAFQQLTERGFIINYVARREDGTLVPLMTADECVARGFFPKGTIVRIGHIQWRKKHPEYEHACRILGKYTLLEVEECDIGNSSSRYKFQGYEGWFNTVLFEDVRTSTFEES